MLVSMRRCGREFPGASINTACLECPLVNNPHSPAHAAASDRKPARIGLAV